METVEEMERRGAFDVHMEDTFPELDRSPDDPGSFRWVPDMWGGYLICGVGRWVPDV